MIVEIVGPIPVGSQRVVWGVFVYDRNGRKIGAFDADSKEEAAWIKQRVHEVFAADGGPQPPS